MVLPCLSVFSPFHFFTLSSFFVFNMQIDILNEAELSLLRQCISDAQHIVICCHKSPDGDALGSSLGLAEHLWQLGKDVFIAIPDAYPDFLQWLPNTEKIVRYDKHPDTVSAAFAKADLVFCLDFNAPERLDDMEVALQASQGKKIMMDHHLDPNMDTVLTVSHPEMCSTSEIVFRIIWQLSGLESMTRRCAVSIYCGMMTDTGGFTYNSSRPEIYFIIGQLLTKGFDKDKIYRNVFNNYSTWAIRLRGYIMYQKLNVFEAQHSSYFAITRQDMKTFHFIKGDAEGLVNEPLKIKGMKLSISLREDDRRDNLVWVSLRSVDNFPCNKMAEQFFNGGGHLNASGGRLQCSIEEAVQKVRQAIIQFNEQLKS